MKLEKVSAGYGQRVVVQNVNIDIRKGEIICLIGPNGGGKSTLLKSINGSLGLMEGAIYLDSRKLSSLSAKEISKELSIVSTERIRPQLMTCKDVVLSGRLPFTGGFGKYDKEDIEIMEKALDIMKIRHLADVSYDALSDGQKQRSLIARAICQSPKYLVMDEPTSYMDIKHRLELMDVVKEMAAAGVTIIMSLHEVELALDVADRLLLVYDDGHVQIEKPEEILSNALIKDLYKLHDDQYKKIEAGLKKDDIKRHSACFVNDKCEYFPCHDLPRERFNCLFCYCPLYGVKDCGGTYRYTDKGIKDCMDCTFPHERDNYPKVIKKLKEEMYKNVEK